MAKKRKKYTLSAKGRSKMEANLAPTRWTAGQSGNPGGRPRGKTVLTRIREKLKERALAGNSGPTRLDTVADAFIRAMEAGSYHHTKEIMEREEGKVPTRVADADGSSLKAYMDMPTGDHPDAP